MNELEYKLSAGLELKEDDVRDLKLSKENMVDLKTIQRVFMMYEDEFLSLDEVLSRVLEFYRKFVPYRHARAHI
jgi:hypothetical protein